MKVKPFKIKDLTPIKSQYIQMVLFEFGYTWGNFCKNTILTSEKYLMFNGINIYAIVGFNSCWYKEITFNEFEEKYGKYSGYKFAIERGVEKVLFKSEKEKMNSAAHKNAYEAWSGINDYLKKKEDVEADLKKLLSDDYPRDFEWVLKMQELNPYRIGCVKISEPLGTGLDIPKGLEKHFTAYGNKTFFKESLDIMKESLESSNIFKNNTMKEKQIKLTVEQAKSMLGKSVEMDELLKANFTLEELGLKKALPKSWEELDGVDGFYTSDDEVRVFSFSKGKYDKDIFKTEKQAKSALAMAQLSQLMYVYNEGWSPDWTDHSIKHCISRIGNSVCADMSYGSYNFLTFNNKETRNEFLTNFRPLIEKYFML